MKKTLLLLIGIVLILASCEKPPVNEWERFYGFTQADIVGHYEANPDESLYEELPTEGVVVYNNASMDITALSETLISLHIVIPEHINRTYSGTIDMTDENRTELIFHGFNEDIMMTVYKNSKGQVRFHGRVKHYYYDAEGTLVNSNIYGFDVIKATPESVSK